MRGQVEHHLSPSRPASPLLRQHGLAQKLPVPVDGKAQPGFQRGDLGPQIVPPVPEALFDSAAIQGKMAHRACPGGPEPVKHRCTAVRVDGEFPAKLAHKAESGRGNLLSGDRHCSECRERKVVPVIRRQGLQHRPGTCAHDTDDDLGFGHVRNRRTPPGGMAAQPRQILAPGGGPGRHAEPVRCDAGERHVRLDATLGVRQGSVNRPTGRDIQICRRQTLHERQGVGAPNVELAKGRQIEHRRAFRHLRGLAGGNRVPRLLAHRVWQVAFTLVPGIPQSTLPPGGHAEFRPGFGPAIVQGGPAQVSPGLGLLERPSQGESVRDGLFHARLEVILRRGARVGAGYVHFPQIHRRCVLDHPVGQNTPNARRGHDPDRIHARRNIKAIDLGRLPDQRFGVDGKALRTVHEMVNARRLQRRNQRQRGLHERHEMIPVLGQFQKWPVAFGAEGIPDLGIRLEPADHQLAGIALDIDAPIKVAQHRTGVGQIGHRLRDNVHVLDRLQGQRNSGLIRQLLRPCTGAQRDLIGQHLGTVGQAHPLGGAVLDQQGGDLYVFLHLDAFRSGDLGIGHAQIERVGIGVFFDPQRPNDSVQVKPRHADLIRPDHRRRQPQMRTQGRDAAQLVHARIFPRQPVAAGLAIPG